jgi:hypothetical protein
VRVLSIAADGRLEIGAGAVHGIREGTFLAIYAPTARHLSGEKDKIADARVTLVRNHTATAVISDGARAHVTLDSKIGIVTPFFGFERLRVRLGNLPGQETTATDNRILTDVATALSSNQLVEVLKSDGPYDVAIRRGCVAGGTFFLAANNPPSPCAAAYYLTPSIGDSQLLGFHVLATDHAAVEALANRIERCAKQENLRGLDNALSPMRGKLAIKLEKVTIRTDPVTGRPTVDLQPDPGTDSTEAIKIGQPFRLKVENHSEQDLFVAIIMIGSSGAMELVSVNPNGDLIKAGTSMVTYATRRAGPPFGLETYKAIATTSRTVDFRILEYPGGAKGPDTSPLQWFIGQSTNTLVKDSAPIKDLKLDDWTTANLNIIIRQ